MDNNIRQNLNWHNKISNLIILSNENRKWDIEKSRDWLPMEVVKDITSIPISCTNSSNTFCWRYSSDGKFRIKYVAWLNDNDPDLVHPNVSFLKNIWNLKVLSRMKIFLWLLIREALPNRDLLTSFQHTLNDNNMVKIVFGNGFI